MKLENGNYHMKCGEQEWRLVSVTDNAVYFIGTVQHASLSKLADCTFIQIPDPAPEHPALDLPTFLKKQAG